LEDDIEEEMKELIAQRKYIEGMEKMMNDKLLYTLRSDLAEKLGQELYGVDGGRYLKKDAPRIQSRIRKQSESYGKRLEAFERALEYEGYTFDGQGVKRRPMHSFEESKMADLHHLENDWGHDTRISAGYIEQFKKLAYERYDAFVLAKDYLEKTGQRDYIEAFADKFSNSGVLRRTDSGLKELQRVQTVTLEEDYELELLHEIKATVYEAEENLEIE